MLIHMTEENGEKMHIILSDEDFVMPHPRKKATGST